MSDQARVSEPDTRPEPVRSRWTPKPEQIVILESIFNSGMVNPPKDETVRIRKLLEKFGSVGDANVFYWFQNRRSRSRRRQRQIQASLVSSEQTGNGGVIQYDGGSGSTSFYNNNDNNNNNNNQCYQMNGGSGSNSSYGIVADGFSYGYNSLGNYGVQDMNQGSGYGSVDNSSLHYQTGMIMVFINGVATEVGRGPLDTKGMFGSELVLVHSSGLPVQVNEYGFLVQSLQHGESYFLVPRNS